MTLFDVFCAIDWSGAKGSRHKGIAISVAEQGDGAPVLIEPPRGAWSRVGVLDWLTEWSSGKRVLVGFDFSFSGPYLDEGRFFPKHDIADARMLWEFVERQSNGADDFYAGDLPAHPDLAPLFLRTNARGAQYSPRLRVTEQRCRDQGFGPAQSLFHLIGPAQVGLASLAGMRFLRVLEGFAIWPFDDAERGGPVTVELYCRLFAELAGVKGKIRDASILNTALSHFGSRPTTLCGPITDHQSDAILSAAGLRALALRAKYWNPATLTDKVRRTEGWTFGVL